MLVATIGSLLCASLFAVSAAPAAKRASNPTGTIKLSTKIPKPGLISVTLFKLTFKLKRGAQAPHQLAIKALNRRRLPRGVAVVATARLLKHSPRHTAVYVGMVAVIRSKTVHGASAAQGEDRDVISGFLFGDTWANAEIRRHKEFQELVEGLGLTLGEPGTWGDVLQELDPHAQGDSAFDEGHAFAWSVNKPPAASSAADRVDNDIAHAMDDNVLDAIIADIERSLEAQFGKEFGEGSLTGPPAPPTTPTTYKYKLDIGVNSASESFSGTPDNSSGSPGPSYSGTATSSWSGVWDIEVYVDPGAKTARVNIAGNGGADPDYKLTGSAHISDVTGSGSYGPIACPAQTIPMSTFQGLQIAIYGGGAPWSTGATGPVSYASTGAIQFETSAAYGPQYLPCPYNQGEYQLDLAPSVFAGIGGNLCGSPAMRFPVSELGADIHFSAPFSYPSPSSTDPDGTNCTALTNNSGSDTHNNTMTGSYAVDMHYQGTS